MKKLSIEEKAKRYDIALDKIKMLLGTGSSCSREELEYVFQELAESEDERIRKWIIENIQETLDVDGFFEGQKTMAKDAIAWLEKQGEPQDKGETSDGYHTFNELYFYRMLYNAAFFNMLPKEWVHKSKKHYDGEDCFGGGWFIVMANLPTGQISNHYELKDWDLFQIPEKEVADKWDGHTPQEAADRLHKYLLEKQGEPTYIPADAVLDSNKDGLIADTIRYKREKQGEQKLNIKKENALVEYSEFKEHLAAIFNAYNGIVIDVQSAVDANADTLIHLACKYQKPVKVPKFKAGDFIQFNGMGHTRYTIKEVCGLSYYINTCNKRMDMSYTDANFELVEKKSSWSEKDERILNGLISSLARIGANTRTDSTSINYTFSREIDWLKSLRPQSQWKPSDEQIFALQGTLPVIKGRGTYQQSLLESLYEDLKKLKD